MTLQELTDAVRGLHHDDDVWMRQVVEALQGHGTVANGHNARLDQLETLVKKMEDFLTDGFETEKAGKYYLAFFAASYDFTAGAKLGSVLTVKSFEYEMPGHHIKKSNMLA